LAEHDLIAFAPGGAPEPWRLVGPEGLVQLEPRAWLGGNEFSLLVGAMVNGLGIGLGELITLERHVKERLLQRVLPDFTMHGGALWAVYPSARRVSPKVRGFIALLKEHLRGAGWINL